MVGVEVVVVLVMVMYVYVTVDWMQYKFLSTCPSKKLFVVGIVLAGGLNKWNAWYCSNVKQRHSVARRFFTDHNFPCLFFVIIYSTLFLLVPIKRQRKLQSGYSCKEQC